MPEYICKTCGTFYPPSEQPPEHCPICEDERQYVGHGGQVWITPETLHTDHHAIIKREEANLTGIGMNPRFAIGQRALLVQSPSGNVLWDCIPLLDDTIIEAVKERGGIDAIAISHPHYYSNMIGWSKAFDVPIYIHEDDREWVMYPHESVQFWSGETMKLNDDLTIIRCGGHFTGGQVLHWPQGADGKGVLLTGDILYVTPDRRYVSFMYSYPNLIPLPASKVQHIVDVLQPYDYDRIYSAWFDHVLAENAKPNVAYSAQRYITAITDKD